MDKVFQFHLDLGYLGSAGCDFIVLAQDRFGRDSFVCVDLGDRSIISWSLPDEHHFEKVY